MATGRAGWPRHARHQSVTRLGRTDALVALGACGFMAFSGLVGQGDPTRVAAQVVTGIGFLGADNLAIESPDMRG